MKNTNMTNRVPNGTLLLIVLIALLGLTFASGCKHVHYGPDGEVTTVEYEE